MSYFISFRQNTTFFPLLRNKLGQLHPRLGDSFDRWLAESTPAMHRAELLFRNICITKCFSARYAGAREREKNEAVHAVRHGSAVCNASHRDGTEPFAFDPGSTPHEKCIRRIPPSQRAEINISIVRRHVIDFINWSASNGVVADG